MADPQEETREEPGGLCCQRASGGVCYEHQAPVHLIARAVNGLKVACADLRAARERLELPPDAEARDGGELPPTAAMAQAAAIECVLADHLQPAARCLEQAAAATDDDLAATWSPEASAGEIEAAQEQDPVLAALWHLAKVARDAGDPDLVRIACHTEFLYGLGSADGAADLIEAAVRRISRAMARQRLAVTHDEDAGAAGDPGIEELDLQETTR